MTNYYPVMLNIEDKECIIFGGGKVALRKVNIIINYGCKITIISEYVCDELKLLIEKNNIKWIQRNYQNNDVNNVFLVFAATNNFEVNKLISKEAKEKGILTNNVSSPEMCTFVVPSIVKRGDLTLTVSTNGKSPLISKFIRQELEQKYDLNYEELLNILGDLRQKAVTRINSESKREDFFNEILKLDPLELIISVGKTELLIKIDELFNKYSDCED